jgi:hypothetical protein
MEMERKLKQYINVTRCLSQHVGANTVCVFANCSSCTDSNLCRQLCSVLDENYKDALKVPAKSKPLTATQIKSVLSNQI